MAENQQTACLAKSQGGSEEGTLAHEQTNIFARISQMGNKTVTSPKESEISELTKSLQTINETMAEMKQDIVSLKSKRSRDEQPQSPIPEKRTRHEAVSLSAYQSCSSDSEEEDAIDSFLSGRQGEAPTGESADSEWLDITDYFENNLETGEEIIPELAGLANGVLRAKPKEEKAMILRNKHKRPANIENLQVSKVDKQLWRQLRRETKSFDYAMQKSQLQLCQAMVPTLKLMQNLKEEGPGTVAKELAADIFKMLAQAIAQSNASRRDSIRKDLLPVYKTLCDNTPSATKLFGDKLQEDINKLKEPKTHLTATRKPFLFKKGGGSNHYCSNFPRTNGAKTYPPQTSFKATWQPNQNRQPFRAKKMKINRK